MNGWTPWQIIALIAVGTLIPTGLSALAAWYALQRRTRELAELSPDERAARQIGEAIGECGGELNIETADELLAIFARSTSIEKQTLVAAIDGLIASAGEDGPQNLPNLNPLLLAIARHIGSSAPAGKRDASNERIAETIAADPRRSVTQVADSR